MASSLVSYAFIQLGQTIVGVTAVGVKACSIATAGNFMSRLPTPDCQINIKNKFGYFTFFCFA